MPRERNRPITPEKRREFEIFLAEKVMGWKYTRQNHPYAADNPYGYEDAEGIWVRNAGDFTPTTDLNQAVLLLDDFDMVGVAKQEYGWHCWVKIEHRAKTGIGINENYALAICLAVAKAYGWEGVSL